MIRQNSNDLIDLRRLQQFVAVVEQGSLTDAAVLLNLSQQALSAAIKALEVQMGTQLFERTRGMRPSVAGLRLYDAAKTLLAGANRLVPEVRRYMADEPEVVRIGHAPSIASIEVFDLISALVPAGVSVHAKPLFPAELTQELFGGSVDIALRRAIETPTGLESTVVSVTRFNVAVVGTDPIASLPSVSMAELMRLRMILWAPESHSRFSAYLVSQFRRAGFEPATVICDFQGFSPEAAPLAVDNGFAMASVSPGTYFGGRISVVALEDEVRSPIQAIALPTISGAVGVVWENLRAAAPASTVQRPE